ncbi:hypothetical protein OEZ85_000577 [Tetradesmus obliquus]|uniref:Cation/H+ exchanger domain-containing protein n=1 Tax=Tetradesmus obliquus TaxID=3088 RepID=A0ABY8UIN3_TETOB|nr:hypothetical protein OEZ85_000577 [Tetradesmus obliquus]
MLPITLLQVLVLAIFFHKSSSTPGIDAAGLMSAVAGLVLFLEGLRVAVMPMALLVGNQLPLKLKLPWVLLVAFCLGVLVTYAEPAIAAIRPLAKLVDPQSAPYLYYMMNQQQELLVLAIGVGVGLASVVGTVKLLTGISIKPFIAGSLLPTVGLACYMQWGNPNLRPILGVAWDCGGVTTGPVTVPILLSLGVGVMKAQRERKQLQAVLEDAAVRQGEGNTLEGFGIVTLASLLPVLAVELMAILTGAILPYEYVLEQASLAAQRAATEQPAAVDTSPIKEVIFGIRAISPLVVALILLVTCVLKQPLPDSGFLVDNPDWEESEDEDEDVSQEEQEGGSEKQEGAGAEKQWRGSSSGGGSEGELARDSGSTSTAAAKDVELGAVQVALAADKYAARDAEPLPAASKTSGAAAAAKPAAAVGMILFNIGLTYGFTALGDMTGSTLPTSFLPVYYAPGSPVYSFAGGVALTMVTVFLLGFLATKAEPALNVLGQTVETLSNRKFTKKALVYAVCAGVAVGMCAGASKILFQLPLLYFILAKYTVACILTAVAKEAITAVAWDSAGVTTGPVTVPFVMSIGVGFSKAVGAPEGFGMLTIMSVAPIISVLLTSLLRKPVKRAAVELARLSKMSLSRMSRRSNTITTAYSNAGESTSSQRDTVIDFAAELAKNSNWSPSLGRASPGLESVAAASGGQLARVSRGMSRTSRPLQAIGEHPAERSAAAAAASVESAGISRLAVASMPLMSYSSRQAREAAQDGSSSNAQ